MQCEASPCFRTGVLPYGSASQPGKEEKQFIIAPLDPALPDGGSALRQHFVRGGSRPVNPVREKGSSDVRYPRHIDPVKKTE